MFLQVTYNQTPPPSKLELTIESLPVPLQTVISSQETWRKKELEENAMTSVRTILLHVYIFAAMAKLSGG